MLELERRCRNAGTPHDFTSSQRSRGSLRIVMISFHISSPYLWPLMKLSNKVVCLGRIILLETVAHFTFSATQNASGCFH